MMMIKELNQFRPVFGANRGFDARRIAQLFDDSKKAGFAGPLWTMGMKDEVRNIGDEVGDQAGENEEVMRGSHVQKFKDPRGIAPVDRCDLRFLVRIAPKPDRGWNDFPSCWRDLDGPPVAKIVPEGIVGFGDAVVQDMLGAVKNRLSFEHVKGLVDRLVPRRLLLVAIELTA